MNAFNSGTLVTCNDQLHTPIASGSVAMFGILWVEVGADCIGRREVCRQSVNCAARPADAATVGESDAVARGCFWCGFSSSRAKCVGGSDLKLTERNCSLVAFYLHCPSAAGQRAA